ncbi:homeobox protein invected-like [Anastrepha ludens]|uniref:homeobox protein invected-like n=1 Tax=Anastrepha ludens TaxID=28586 RepID=UPI0023B1E743|nr:homeobox protein invected-like [Anastrepha ludens]
MSTAATTRATLTQHALSSPTPEIAVNSSASVSPITQPNSVLTPHSHTHTPVLEQLCALRRHRVDMHPDCMLLQAHGVTSPRLSPNMSVLAGEKRRRHSQPMSMDETEEAEEVCEGIDSTDEMDVVGDAEEREIIVAERKRELEDKSAVACCEDEVDAEADIDEEDDALSLCSEDSELSVGQEEGSAATSGCYSTPSFCDFNQQRRLLLSNVGNMMALCAPSAFSSVHTTASACGDGSDARSSASTDENTMQQLDDESIGSSTGIALQQQPPPPPPPSTVLDPYVVANALRMPVPVLPRATTHTSPFQTEFIRKSHMYAEELVKQQMQFMAAARASAFTLRGANAAETVAAERRAMARIQGTPQQMSNFVGIQSQLTAITKMSQLSAAAAAAAVAVAAVANNNQPVSHSHQQQLLQQQQQHKPNFPNNADALTKLNALTTAHTHLSPTAVSSLSQLQAQMQAHFPYAHSNHANNNLNNNNNLNEPALKFSIDNILKADFGRRLAEGAACMAACNNSTRSAKTCSGSSNNNNAMQRARKAVATLSMNSAANNAGAGAASAAIAIDLTHLCAAASTTTTTATLNFSHTLANICTNSSDSNSTAVSSSYGGASDQAKSPAAATAAANGDLTASAAKCVTEFNAKTTEDTNASSSSSSVTKSSGTGASGSGPIVWPAWVYCTRYSDRPSSGR